MNIKLYMLNWIKSKARTKSSPEPMKLKLEDGLKFGDSTWTKIPEWLENADTSEIHIFRMMFVSNSVLSDCNISKFDMSNATDLSNMFQYNSSLSSETINNILKALDTVPISYATKTLAHLGFSRNQYNRVDNMTNWPSLVEKGWTKS